MHPTVTVLQLSAIIIITILRLCAHINRKTENAITDHDEVEGYGFDWLAKDLWGCETWEVSTGPNARGERLPPYKAVGAMKIRARLARLSIDWKLENRVKVKTLQNAIEAAINQASATMALKLEDKHKSSCPAAVCIVHAPVGGKYRKNWQNRYAPQQRLQYRGANGEGGGLGDILSRQL